MVRHYRTFLYDHHRLRAPINHLLVKKNTRWIRFTDFQAAFEKIRQLLISNLLLPHYDPLLRIVAASDASKYGIESEKVISHLARFLITTGRNCCHVEKGSLQIIFVVNKFHKMIFGRHHKPLLAVFGLKKKGIRVHTAS